MYSRREVRSRSACAVQTTCGIREQAIHPACPKNAPKRRHRHAVPRDLHRRPVCLLRSLRDAIPATATRSLIACSITHDLGRLSALAIFATCPSSSDVSRMVSEAVSVISHQYSRRSDALAPHQASRPRAGRAMPGPVSASSRAARCSASCLSNIALAAALRLALNSARLSPHH